MFFNDLQFNSSTPSEQRYEYVQSAEPESMQTAFQALLTAIVAENLVRVAAQQLALNVVDLDIAGGGDGHTFVVRLLLSTYVTFGAGTGWPSANLATARGIFWIASTAEALHAAAPAALAGLQAAIDAQGQSVVTRMAAGMAGAAKGTRFMAFIAGTTV